MLDTSQLSGNEGEHHEEYERRRERRSRRLKNSHKNEAADSDSEKKHGARGDRSYRHGELENEGESHSKRGQDERRRRREQRRDERRRERGRITSPEAAIEVDETLQDETSQFYPHFQNNAEKYRSSNSGKFATTSFEYPSSTVQVAEQPNYVYIPPPIPSNPSLEMRTNFIKAPLSSNNHFSAEIMNHGIQNNDLNQLQLNNDRRIQLLIQEFDRDRHSLLEERDRMLTDARNQMFLLEEKLHNTSRTLKNENEHQIRLQQQEIDHLKMQVANAERREKELIGEQQVLLSRHSDQIHNLSIEINDMKRENNDLKREKDNLKLQNEDLRGEREFMRQDILTIRQERDMIRDKLSTIASTSNVPPASSLLVETLERQVESLKDQLRLIEKDLMIANDQLAASFQQQKPVINHKNNEIVDELKGEIVELKLKIKTLTQQLEDKRSDFEASTREIERLKNVLKDERELKERFEAQYHNSLSEMTDLKKELLKRKRETEELAFENVQLRKKEASAMKSNQLGGEAMANSVNKTSQSNTYASHPPVQNSSNMYSSQYNNQGNNFQQPPFNYNSSNQTSSIVAPPPVASPYENQKTNLYGRVDPSKMFDRPVSPRPPSSREPPFATNAELRNFNTTTSTSFVADEPYQIHQKNINNFANNGPPMTNPHAPAVAPYGTDTSFDFESQSVSQQLLVLCQERDEIEHRLSKYPANSMGRTVAERRDRVALESRLNELGVEITRARQTLRRSGRLKL
eukprot:GDKK01059421.1.p1 GENE.GDKK01059421.1~~GDKK01059421.1.p1  ORF type:complete len:781 (-),score=224.40 GDKK01059421.1:197-2437(-)